jgi:hypothetical protein
VSKVVVSVPPVAFSVKGQGEVRLDELIRREVGLAELGTDLAGPLEAVALLVGHGAAVFAGS